jgi:hypothetical protein
MAVKIFNLIGRPEKLKKLIVIILIVLFQFIYIYNSFIDILFIDYVIFLIFLVNYLMYKVFTFISYVNNSIANFFKYIKITYREETLFVYQCLDKFLIYPITSSFEITQQILKKKRTIFVTLTTIGP